MTKNFMAGFCESSRNDPPCNSKRRAFWAARRTQCAWFPGFAPLPRVQMDLYKEALLIFYSKVSVYLRALGKTPPEQWRKWIG